LRVWVLRIAADSSGNFGIDACIVGLLPLCSARNDGSGCGVVLVALAGAGPDDKDENFRERKARTKDTRRVQKRVSVPLGQS